MKEPPDRSDGRRQALLILAVILLALAAFVLGGHFVKAYSDPSSWVNRARLMMEGDPVTRRAPVYPLYLILALKTVGPVYVYLANLPLILLMTILVYLLTMKCYGMEQGPGSGGYSAEARSVAVVAVSVLLVMNRGMLLELANPFREMLAFSLMLGSLILVLHYLDRGKMWLLPPAGALLGLAAGTRETCVLILLPLGFLYLYSVARGRIRQPLRVILFFGAGLIVGLAPLIVQNTLHSGHFWLPSYAARKVAVGGGLKAPKDLPVPGMSLSYFSSTGKAALLYFLSRYGWAGMALLGFGVADSVWKKRSRVLLLLVPAAAVNFIFYSFYWYMQERYFFVVDLFLAPVMAFGVVALWSGLLGGVRRLRPAFTRRYDRTVVYLALAAVLLSLGLGYEERREGFKLWHVDDLRSTVLPHLKEPYRIVSANGHFNRLFSWLLDTSHVGGSAGLPEKMTGTGVFEEALSRRARENLELYSKYHVYSYGRPFLLTSWFNFHPVLSLTEFETPPDYYGKTLEGTLYEVRPWSGREYLNRVKAEKGTGKTLLLVDFRRLWDYPGRTFCRLLVDGRIVEDRVPNGLHFVELPPGMRDSGVLEVRALSDAPLPAAPVLEASPLNGRIDIPLGAGPVTWPYPLLSESLVNVAPLKSDAALLFDRGTVRVPKFAGEDRRVFLALTFELFQEDPTFRRGNTLAVTAGGEGRRVKLPGWRSSDTMTIDLGAGTGRLEMEAVELATNLPPFLDQRRMKKAGEISKYGYVKLYSLALATLPALLEGRQEVDIGTSDDAPWILNGFYERARHRGRAVRWTGPSAVLRLPRPTEGRGLEVKVVVYDLRPPGYEEVPLFKVNGEPVSGDDVTTFSPEEGVVEYRFLLEREAFFRRSGGELEIVSRPWVPARVLGTGDERELGHLVDRVEWQIR